MYKDLQLDLDFNINDSWLHFTSLALVPFDSGRLATSNENWGNVHTAVYLHLRKKCAPPVCMQRARTLPARHPITVDPRCFDSTASKQAHCKTTQWSGASNNAPVGKMITKIVSFGYKNYEVVDKNYEVVDKKQVAICKTCGRRLQMELPQCPTLFDTWSCTKNGKFWTNAKHLIGCNLLAAA